MSTYLSIMGDRYKAESHHSFVLYGNTRDLQIGDAGSCGLVEHMIAKFGNMKRVPVVFRVGLGWKFAVDSDRGAFLDAVGLSENSSGAFAGLGEQEDPLPLDVNAAVGLIDIAMRQTKIKVAIIVDRMELVVPNNPYDRMQAGDKVVLSILQALASDPNVAASQNILVGITDTLSDIHESIRYASSRWFAIEILPPDADERRDIADRVLPQLAESGIAVDLGTNEFAQATSMLTRYGLMDIFSDAQLSGALTRSQVREVKARVMAQEYGDILQALDPLANGLSEIAGLDVLKDYMLEIVDNMVAGKRSDVPSGILFAGAPGLGKTHFVRGLAGSAGLPVINFNVGKLLGSFVGQSERNLERAVTAIVSAAPAIVILDEIETTFPDRANAAPSGDSGVSSRILKRMLEVLSDPALRGRVLWIGITNYPQKLDAALSRAGRFDLTVAFLPPTDNERDQLIRLYAQKYDVPDPDNDTLPALVARTNGYTNAEIENVVRKFRQLRSNSKYSDQYLSDLWTMARDRVRANTRGVGEMTDSALLAVNDSDLLPEEYIDRWKRITGQVEAPALSQPNPSAQPVRGSRSF